MMHGTREWTAPMVAAALGFAAPGDARAQPFDFENDAQGWMVYNLPASGHGPPLIPSSDAPWTDADGLPPGALRITDLRGDTGIGPPASALGDWSARYADDLTFDIYYRFTDNVTYGQVVLRGADLTLYIPEPPESTPLVTWLHRSYPLSEHGPWRVNSLTGPPPTREQFTAVLADVRGFYIRTEWHTSPDDTTVDNVGVGCVTACEADTTCDGAVNSADISAFLTIWLVSVTDGSLTADFNADGAVNSADISAMLTTWLSEVAGGCGA